MTANNLAVACTVVTYLTQGETYTKMDRSIQLYAMMMQMQLPSHKHVGSSDSLIVAQGGKLYTTRPLNVQLINYFFMFRARYNSNVKTLAL